MRLKNDSGSVSLVLLVVLLALSIVALGVSSVVRMGISQVKNAEEREEQLEVLREVAAEIVEAIVDDPTPEAHSQIDPVHRAVEEIAASGDVEIAVEDHSGKLGINWIRKEVLDELGLLSAGERDDFQQHREEIGFRLNIAEEYDKFFEEDLLADYFTPYSYWNVNIADEFALEELYTVRTGDSDKAADFRLEIQELRIKKSVLFPSQLSGLVEDRNLLQVLIAEAPLNIHSLHENLLIGLLDYFEAPSGVAERIRSTREDSELTDEWLTDALKGTENAALLLQYIGVRSWFWKIMVSGPELRLEWIVCRLVELEDEGGFTVQLLEERIFRSDRT